jgi:uncharacterized membrane protein YeaQ/YmgE (transglycosylase-associated protein family)
MPELSLFVLDSNVITTIKKANPQLSLTVVLCIKATIRVSSNKGEKLMSLISLLAWLVIGGVAGWLASLVMKTDSQQGTLVDIFVGIVGAFIGGFVLNTFGLAADAGEFSILSLVTAFVGAVILLAIIKLLRRA